MCFRSFDHTHQGTFKHNTDETTLMKQLKNMTWVIYFTPFSGSFSLLTIAANPGGKKEGTYLHNQHSPPQ
jgi:hypothetical protein